MRPKQKVKLKDIADSLGVSVVTVSNSLAGRPGVSPEMRSKIKECAAKMGLDYSKYQKPISVKDEKPELAGKTIGVIVSERYMNIGASFYWEMYQKVAYAVSEINCFTSLTILKDYSDKAKLPAIIDVDGIIIIGPVREKYLERLLSIAKVPVVLMDQQIEMGNYTSVLSGNYYGMYRATRELVLAGHEKIGFVGALDYSRNIIDRYYGYKKCMRENGLKVNRKWVLSDRCGDNETPLVVLPEELPTAFACSSDYAAGILYNALKERGINVPDDLSLVGYDNYLLGSELEGKLTTYNVDMVKMARLAVNQVIKEIDDPSLAGTIYEIDSVVVKRSSIKDMGEK